LESMPCVGLVTIEVVLAEAGDIRRFGSQRKATAYAGLAPGIRESAGKAKQLGITKQGSQLLRTTLVETVLPCMIVTPLSSPPATSSYNEEALGRGQAFGAIVSGPSPETPLSSRRLSTWATLPVISSTKSLATFRRVSTPALG